MCGQVISKREPHIASLSVRAQCLRMVLVATRRRCIAPFAEVILLLESWLLSFPVVVPVENRTTAVAGVLVFGAQVVEPFNVQFLIVSFEASAIKRMVEVPAVEAVLVLIIVSELPPVFNPSMVTLSAPFKSISGAATLPVKVRAAPPLG